MKKLETALASLRKYNRLVELYEKQPESHKAEVKPALDNALLSLDVNIKDYLENVKITTASLVSYVSQSPVDIKKLIPDQDVRPLNPVITDSIKKSESKKSTTKDLFE